MTSSCRHRYPLLRVMGLAACQATFAGACAGREDRALVELSLESSQVVGRDYEGTLKYRYRPNASPGLRVTLAAVAGSAAMPRVNDEAVLVQYRTPAGVWEDVASLPPPGEYFPSRKKPKTVDLGIIKEGRLRALVLSGASQRRRLSVSADARRERREHVPGFRQIRSARDAAEPLDLSFTSLRRWPLWCVDT
jgi:hypothetical protein